MRIYKQKYKSRSGETKQSKKWYVRLNDHMKITQAFPAFTDKQQSIRLGEKIEKLVVLKINNEPTDRELSEWLSQIPASLRDKFAKIGLIDSQRAAAGKSLTKHLEDFKNSLSAKGTSAKQVGQTVSRIKKAFDVCGFNNWNEIRSDLIQREIPKLHKYVERVEIKKIGGKKVKRKKLKDLGLISSKTANYYLKAVKQFCNWMVNNRRASESPVDYLQPINNHSESRQRRALEPDQLRLLLKAAQARPKRFGMTGPARAMLYQLAVETGLRANELRSLNKSSFDFDNCIVTVEAGSTKNKKNAILPLKKDTAKMLEQFLSSKALDAKAFKVPQKTADMLKEDLAAAGIPYVDDQDRYADFHALRHTTGSWLAASGVHPKVAQVIMRHSDINLTMSRYTHIFRGQESEAIAKLPDLSFTKPKVSQKSDAHMEEEKNVLPPGLPPEDGKSRMSANSDELLPTCINKRKAPFPAQNQQFQAKNEAFLQRGRRGSNPQPSDRQSDALAN